MAGERPILVTGAAGQTGAIGHTIVEQLRKRELPVRALVRRVDERSQALSALGAEVVVGDLTNGADVVRALQGCRRMYFGMSVSQPYLEATVIAAAAAKQIPDFEVLVNISQMTVSQMNLQQMTESPQQRQHWLGEQVLNWSAVPVVHVRSTVFLEHFFFSGSAAHSIMRDGTIRLPFGTARTSPIAGQDVASVITTILTEPKLHIGKVYELTGASSQDMSFIAKEYEKALGRPVKYVDVPWDEWQKEFESHGLTGHVAHHILVMAKLHAANRYDRFTSDVEKITGKPSMTIASYIASRPDLFKVPVR